MQRYASFSHGGFVVVVALHAHERHRVPRKVNESQRQQQRVGGDGDGQPRSSEEAAMAAEAIRKAYSAQESRK